MGTHKSQAVRRETKQVRLGFECLEVREVLACTASVTAGVLTIAGDANANKIKIVDEGGNVSLECDGQKRSFTGVNSINLSSAGGNDSVSYRMARLANASRSLSFDLGDGDDRFSARGLGVANASATLNVTVNGGNGNDRLSTGPVAATSGTATVSVNGGTGNDQIQLGSNGSIGGRIDLTADGGDGNDRVSAQLKGSFTATGAQVNATLRGGNGDDQLTATPPKDQRTRVSIDGGAGTDRCRPSQGSVGCE